MPNLVFPVATTRDPIELPIDLINTYKHNILKRVLNSNNSFP